jgi:hypothetical protein
MSIKGLEPLDGYEAETAYNRTFFYLQKVIDADLRQAQTDERVDRAVMGAVVAQRALIEAFPSMGFRCHTDH